VEKDQQLRERDWKERQRLVQKALKQSGGAGEKGAGEEKQKPEADTWYGYGEELEEESCHEQAGAEQVDQEGGVR
jgi:hypothetical protein